MINLMYLVFIGMLALNVSTEVLDGFELVEESLLRSVKSSTQRNERIFKDLEEYFNANEEKTRAWYEKGDQVKDRTDSLFNYIQDLKTRIVKKSDGKNGNPEELKHPDDLNAAYEIMFERGKNDGAKLKSDINSYREYVISMVNNPSIQEIIKNNLSTEPSRKAKENKQTWEESMFWQMPVAAAITLLTKMQNDIRNAEGVVLSDLVKNIDVSDYRVNKVEPFVIPQSQIVMRGSSYQANIGLLAQDSTQRPRIFVNGKYLPDEANGHYVVGTGATGTFPVKGYIEMPLRDDEPKRYEFSTQYSVVEPNATVASMLMNVLYPGIDNELKIAASGIPSHNVTATMTNGTLTRKNDEFWIARPAKAGTEAIISVQAKMPDGKIQEMVKNTFKVKSLPTPSIFLMITDAKGNPEKFEGGALGKSTLLGINEIVVAIDDGLLNIPFTVLRFETTVTDKMGYDAKEVANNARFTDNQKAMMRDLARGKRILIRSVVARGPDGSERTLKAPLEIIVN
jgi:gliding motility-associated protein GldM